MFFGVKSPSFQWEITLGFSSIEFAVLGCSHKNGMYKLVASERCLQGSVWRVIVIVIHLPRRVHNAGAVYLVNDVGFDFLALADKDFTGQLLSFRSA